MKSKNGKFLGLLSLMAVSVAGVSTANAEDAKGSAKKSATKTDPSLFQCAKINSNSLKEFKEKLIANCNLEKPYTMAATDISLSFSYYYCCHLLKSADE